MTRRHATKLLSLLRRRIRAGAALASPSGGPARLDDLSDHLLRDIGLSRGTKRFQHILLL